MKYLSALFVIGLALTLLSGVALADPVSPIIFRETPQCGISSNDPIPSYPPVIAGCSQYTEPAAGITYPAFDSRTITGY